MLTFFPIVKSISVQRSSLVSEESILSACFLCDGKLSSSSYGVPVVEEGKDFPLKGIFDDKLSLIIRMFRLENGEYQVNSFFSLAPSRSFLYTEEKGKDSHQTVEEKLIPRGRCL